MKKLIFILMLVLSTSVVKANPETFVRSYSAIAIWNDNLDDWDDWKPIKCVVVFNYKGTSKVAIYFGEDDPMILFPIKNEVKTKTNSSGLKYQEMKYLTDDGEEIDLLLFDKGTLILGSEDDALCFRPAD